MSLSSALDTAKSSLMAAQTQTAVLSRNIANVNTVGATRKYAEAVTGNGGQVLIKSITQSSNTVLYRNMLDANSAVGRGNVIANGLNRINETIGDTALGRSPAALISKLGDALNTLAASPNNYELARTAATAANDVVVALNEASDTVQTIRRDADDELVIAAEEMTKLLAEIESLNRRVVTGTYAGTDVTDLNDQRDQAVVELSSYVGLTVQKRGQNDLVLYTDSGVTLFEGTARAVEYSGSGSIGAVITEGAAFRIDGVEVTGSNAVMPLKSGSVAGLVALRDETTVTYQTQLDEIARGLIETFKETSAAGAITQGIFTASGYTNTASVSVGTFAAGSLTTADVLTFDFLQGDTTYRATVSFTSGVPATAAAYQALLQTAVDTATPIGGG
ncbi:MAG: flagellar hook-associated protein FlgK, partial [Rhizobiaceae bacterium]|nr:flagellar hook-associated protein FlgK [Rhizobiaceae bacterium]